MHVETGEIRTAKEMVKGFLDAPPPKQWTRFGTGDVVALHNLAGKRVGWFRIQLITKKKGEPAANFRARGGDRRKGRGACLTPD